MTTITEDVVRHIAETIAREFSPLRIVVFGSCARGEITPDSDVDLLVVEDRDFDERHSRTEEACRIRRALLDVLVPIDVLVCTPDDIDQWKDSRNHVISHALREGRVLYG